MIRPSKASQASEEKTQGQSPVSRRRATPAKAARETEALLRQRRAWLAPIVDLTAQNLWFADSFADAATPGSLRSGVERALDILASLGRLPTAVLDADDRETALLARVYSRGQRLEPLSRALRRSFSVTGSPG